jgi:3-methylcrotonyl-CoA carboxylase alpha subunit
MFESVLVANRGEIAVRVMATCQEMGIRTIAVYSEADQSALHVRTANVAYPIGPAPARDSYLNIETLIRVAKESGAEAIHPGYGFLSENAEFAEACARAGIIFIGPPADAIRLMGSKTAAKSAVEAAGVPTVPGYSGTRRDLPTLRREAARIGYPVMIKAAAGGGGKGMRVVGSSDELGDAVAGAQREALAAFGDETIFLEKLITAPRHVEFQILADNYGHVIHLGERDCSIQRRHQKVVEESPCLALTGELRAKMGSAAVKAAVTAGYVNAGTCEFLLDAEDHYYFLEMNTRLQVEHPVTELVTGLDLVRLQLAIAAGEPLPYRQEEITSRGHAFEVRIYAEDPAAGYLPSTGRLSYIHLPAAPGIRIDAGITSGDEVTLHYDPMLAKLVVYGSDRAAAVERLHWALDRSAVLGVATNIPLLQAIVRDPDFKAGAISTAFLEARGQNFAALPAKIPPVALVAAAFFEVLSPSHQPFEADSRSRRGGDRPYNPWTGGSGLGSRSGRSFRYHWGEEPYLVTLNPEPTGSRYKGVINGEPFLGREPSLAPGQEAEDDGLSARMQGEHSLVLEVGVSRKQVTIARSGFDLQISYGGEVYLLRKPRPLDVEASAHSGEATAGRQVLLAPMAGTVIKVPVREGDRVSANETLVVLGAMKMEHAITAPYSGVILRLPHAAGDVVPGGEILVELDTGGENTV